MCMRSCGYVSTFLQSVASSLHLIGGAYGDANNLALPICCEIWLIHAPQHGQGEHDEAWPFSYRMMPLRGMSFKAPLGGMCVVLSPSTIGIPR